MAMDFQFPDPEHAWWERWRALRDAIDATLAQRPPDPFQHLLQALREFGQRQYAYFFVGFSHDMAVDERGELLSDANWVGELQLLVKDEEWHPEAVLRSLIDQLASDFERIQRALLQRTQGKAAQAQIDTLAIADAWGRQMLEALTPAAQPAPPAPLLDQAPLVLTYFSRSPHIRRVPYAPVALVGIPFTAVRQRTDLLTLPHELGHYVYWHGRFQEVPLSRMLHDLARGQNPYVLQWIEEIFADVCGMLIGLELAVVPAALRMIRDNRPRDYVRNNRVHPVDAARLTVYITVLKALETRWPDTPALTGMPARFQGSRAAMNEAMSVAETNLLELLRDQNASFTLGDVRGDVRSLSNLCLQIMTPAFRMSRWETSLQRAAVELLAAAADASPVPSGLTETPVSLTGSESTQIDARSAVPDLHAGSAAARTVLHLSGLIEAISLILQDARVKAWEDGFKAGLPSPEPVQPLPPLADRPAFMVLRDTPFEQPVEPAVWKLVLAADGWTVKGPETQPTGDWEADWTNSALHQ